MGSSLLLSTAVTAVSAQVEKRHGAPPRASLEAQVNAILQSPGNAIVTVDLGGVVTSWNPGAERILGRRAEEMVGRAVEAIVVPADRHRLTAALAGVVGDPQSRESEVAVTRSDGSVVDVAVTISPVVEAGTVVELAIIGADTTQRRRAEQELRRHEQQLAEAQRVAGLGSWSWCVMSDTVEWSDQLFRIFGLPPGSFNPTYDGFLERVEPRYRPVVEEAVRRSLGGEPYDVEFRIVRGDRALRWIHARGTVERDQFGAPLRLLGTAQDITERRQADEVRFRLAAIVDSSDDAIFSSSVDGRIVSWNKGAENLYGYSAEEVVGRPLSLLVAHGCASEVDGVVARAQGGEPVHNFETVHVRKNGTLVPVSLTVSPVPDAGGGTATSTIARDITERKRLEAELEAARDQAMEVSRLKSDFLATMSHEIRTPMNGVIGMTGLLLDTELDAEQREFVQTVRRSGEALLDIINDILDFSKIEAGKLDLEIVDVDLRSVVEEVADLLADQAHAKGLELATMVGPDVPTKLRGDPGRIRQILINLASNAVKFTESGEVVVRVVQAHDDDGEVLVRVEVADTGIGIAPAALSALFNPFSQADSSTTRRYGGTGLGLAICKQLVDLMGGQIDVESEPGRGSTFTFTVPMGKDLHEPACSPESTDLAGLRTLVVDDNATSRAILVRYLTSWGMTCTAVDGGREALHALQQAGGSGKAFELVLIDMEMPHMNGLQLARAIADDGALPSAPLLLTSASVQGAAMAARRAGFSAYLTKPVRQSQLYDAIATVRDGTGGKPDLVTQNTIAERRAHIRPRLLVAEDNAVNQKVAVAMLAKLGYGADVVGNGAEALAALSRMRYGAVLMDCQMPEMDGYAATAEVRRHEEGSSHVPIIAMTAGVMAGDRERCLAVGMDDYVAKPVKLGDLAAVLKRWTEPRKPAGDRGRQFAQASP